MEIGEGRREGNWTKRDNLIWRLEGGGETGPRHSGDHDKLVSATTGLITTL